MRREEKDHAPGSPREQSPGPWVIDQDWVRDARGQTIMGVLPGYRHTATRIVTCVNLLAGVPSWQLEFILRANLQSSIARQCEILYGANAPATAKG
jgi:hypothetical protein